VKDEFFSHKIHFIKVLEEYILLYKKRQIEIKRAIKASHRAAILPHPRVLYNLLEANIGYLVASACLKAIQEIPDSSPIAFEKFLAQSVQSKNSNSQFNQLFESFKSFIQKEGQLLSQLQLQDRHFHLLLTYALQVDEEQRKVVLEQFLSDFSSQIIKLVLNEIAIFDQHFINEIISSYQKFSCQQR